MARTPTDPTKAQVWVTKGLDDLDFEFYFPQGPKGDPGGITLGTTLAANHLDNYKSPGVFRQDDGANSTLAKGYPITSSGVLYVDDRLGGQVSVVQRYYPFTGASGVNPRQFYHRYLVNSTTWGPWEAYVSQRVDQTAGRAIYTFDTVNQREQLMYGDTGIRRIETAFINGWTAALASIRRVNNVVSLGLYTVNPTAKTADIAYNIPSGFKPAGYGGNIAFPIRYSGASNTDWMQITGAGALYPPVGAISGNGYICVSSWTTVDSWPTTLPGTAVGTIPNA